ncbi:MarR family transcriptional regulator [Nitrosospira lacus]|uniref:MarR family transcriptional regulator n=1 Tax=Nitrosospira lacus TaxID=1288494 RepID=A0A1W6SQ90_9PROT|nr:MarR family transcriptional regulator [Nitrosospira lacus]
MSIAMTALSSALSAFKEFTGDPDVQVQAIQTFLKVATTSNPSVDNIARTIGLSQSTASRNVLKLSAGPRAQDGYGLITVELDPYDGRKRIIKLSARGHELVRFIEERTMPKLRSHFIHELLLNA